MFWLTYLWMLGNMEETWRSAFWPGCYVLNSLEGKRLLDEMERLFWKWYWEGKKREVSQRAERAEISWLTPHSECMKDSCWIKTKARGFEGLVRSSWKSTADVTLLSELEGSGGGRWWRTCMRSAVKWSGHKWYWKRCWY